MTDWWRDEGCVTKVDHKESMGRYFCSSKCFGLILGPGGWTSLVQNDPLTASAPPPGTGDAGLEEVGPEECG